MEWSRPIFGRVQCTRAIYCWMVCLISWKLKVWWGKLWRFAVFLKTDWKYINKRFEITNSKQNKMATITEMFSKKIYWSIFISSEPSLFSSDVNNDHPSSPSDTLLDYGNDLILAQITYSNKLNQHKPKKNKARKLKFSSIFLLFFPNESSLYISTNLSRKINRFLLLAISQLPWRSPCVEVLDWANFSLKLNPPSLSNRIPPASHRGGGFSQHSTPGWQMTFPRRVCQLFDAQEKLEQPQCRMSVCETAVWAGDFLYMNFNATLGEMMNGRAGVQELIVNVCLQLV